MVLSETGSSTTTTLTASTNNSTQVSVKGASRVLSSPTLSSSTLSGGTTTLTQAESDWTRDKAASSMSLYEAGGYGGGFALSSVVLKTGRQETVTSGQTVSSSEVGQQWSLLLNSKTGLTYSLTSATMSDQVVSGLTSYSKSSLTDKGDYGAGSYSLGTVLYTGSGLSCYSRTETQTVVSLQTTTVLALTTKNTTGTSLTTRTTATNQYNDGLFSWNANERGNYGAGSYALSSVVLRQTAWSALSSVTLSQATSTSASVADKPKSTKQTSMLLNALQPVTSLLPPYTVTITSSSQRNGVGYSQETQSSSQDSDFTLYQAGQYGHGSYSLSSFNLSQNGVYSSSDVLKQSSQDTVNTTVTLGNSQVTLVSGTASTSLTQNTSQSQSSNLLEKGTYNYGGQNGLYLSQVSISLSGNYTASSSRRNYDNSNDGNDYTSVKEKSLGSFHFSGLGSYAAGSSLTLSSFTFTGGASGGYVLIQNGSADEQSYEHADTWSETSKVAESGSYSALSGGLVSNYSSSLRTSEVAYDKVVGTGLFAPSSGWQTTTLSSQVTVTGSGSRGFQQSLSQGTTTWNGQSQSYKSPSSTTVTLQLPNIQLNGQAPINLNPSSNNWLNQTTAAGLLGVALPSTLAPLVGPSSSLATMVQAPTLPTTAPPQLPGLSMPAYGAWLGGPQGQNPTLLAWPDQQNLSGLWRQVNQAYQDGLAKFANAGQNPLSMYSSGVWDAATAALPAGAQFSYNFWYLLGQGLNFVGGALNALTGGLSTRLLGGLLINPNTTAYQVGGYVGQALNIVLMVNPGALGSLGSLLLKVGSAGGMLSAADEAWHGNFTGALLQAAGAVSHALSGVTPCVAGKIGVAVGLVATGQSLVSAYNNFTKPGGDPIAGVLDLIQAAVTFKVQVASSCFTGRMLVDWEGGKIRVDQVRVGDWIWSQNEDDPAGPPTLKRVLQLFQRLAPIWAVTFDGQTIETTAEHPFWVANRGWIPTQMLKVGDLLQTRDKRLVPVESVEDTGRVETVHNFLVEDLHTYFVSATKDGASVWAHNTYTEFMDLLTKGKGRKLSERQARQAYYEVAARGEGDLRTYLGLRKVTPAKINKAVAMAKADGKLGSPKTSAAPQEVGPWKGPTDYSSLKDPKDVVSNTKPTSRQMRQMKELNRTHNDGVLRDDVTGELMGDSPKFTRGNTPPPNSASIDHKLPVSKGGTRSFSNLLLRTLKNNRDKWDS